MPFNSDNNDGLGGRFFSRLVVDFLTQKHQTSWRNSVMEMPKLRTYKNINETFSVQPYVRSNISRQDRSLIARMRCGVFPIELELGRYRGIPADRRFCKKCDTNSVEDENHFLLTCPVKVQGTGHREPLLLQHTRSENQCDLATLSDGDKLKLLLSVDVKPVSKFISDIFKLRSTV